MNVPITIRRQINDLHAREYDFVVLDRTLQCIRYQETTRENRRQCGGDKVARC